MNVEAKIVGFDRRSELVAVEVPVPASVLDRVKEIADVPPTDPTLVGSYPLTEQQLAMIAKATRIKVDPREYQYFLEAYNE